ncbi:MAG: ThuA domain-containing protein [Verrucomicrobiota bacterium]
MKSPALFPSLTLLLLSFVWVAVAQNDKKEKPKTWKEKAAERFGDNPTNAHKAEIEANLPSARKESESPRKVLVFYRCEGFIHTSIPFGNHAMKAIAESTEAFSADFADEYNVFTEENLSQYDAIIFNNTTHLDPNEEQRASIMSFIEGGKGIVGFHAAADNFGKWPEGIALIGGIFNGHPWTAGGTWAFQVEDPEHPLNEAFGGNGFWHKDEIYWYKPESFEGRERLRILLSLDMSKPKNAEPLGNERWKDKVDDPTAIDVPVSWCKEVGAGRLFFTNLGHNDMTFGNRMVLQHMLDGIQFAMGDIEADAVPSGEVEAKIVGAPETPPKTES